MPNQLERKRVRARARALPAVHHVAIEEIGFTVKSGDCEFFIFGLSLDIASAPRGGDSPVIQLEIAKTPGSTEERNA